MTRALREALDDAAQEPRTGAAGARRQLTARGAAELRFRCGPATDPLRVIQCAARVVGEFVGGTGLGQLQSRAELLGRVLATALGEQRRRQVRHGAGVLVRGGAAFEPVDGPAQQVDPGLAGLGELGCRAQRRADG